MTATIEHSRYLWFVCHIRPLQTLALEAAATRDSPGPISETCCVGATYFNTVEHLSVQNRFMAEYNNSSRGWCSKHLGYVVHEQPTAAHS